MALFCLVFLIFCLSLCGTHRERKGNAKGTQRELEELYIPHPDIQDISSPPNTSKSARTHEFRYEGTLGTKNWSRMFKSCAGNKQSPIAIENASTSRVSYGHLITNNFYQFPSSIAVTNNGHSATVTLVQDKTTIAGGNLPGEFQFLNLHFHWGIDSVHGSEHTIDGKPCPLELHMIHWNLKYHSFEEAIENEDGIAVLAVLFHVSPTDSPVMEPIINDLGYVAGSNNKKCTNTATLTQKFRLLDLLPKNTNDYYRYHGSLTTPECRESVIWTVFANTLPISERQLDVFRKLLDPENVANHRPVQPLNSRIVYRNFV